MFVFNKIKAFSGEQKKKKKKKNPLLNTTLTLMMDSYIFSVRSALWDFWSSGLICEPWHEISNNVAF